MATRTRKISVNFFQIVPGVDSEAEYARLAACFSELDLNTLGERVKKLDFVLEANAIERKDGLLTGAILNEQTGGMMPVKKPAGRISLRD